MTTPDTRIPIHHPRTASRLFGEEAVVISIAPEENTVRMLNPVGSRIWDLIDGQRSVDEIAEVLVIEFEVDLPQARQSVAAFIDQLVDKQLSAWR